MKRRVVITGLGALSGFGVGIDRLWQGLVEGRSALRPITRFDASGFRSRLAAEVADFSGAKDLVPKSYRKAVKVMARDIELAVAAARCAVEDARLVTRGTAEDAASGGSAPTYPGSRMGCHIGAGLIAAEADELTMAMSTSVREAQQSGPGAQPLPTLDLRAWGNVKEDGGNGGMNNLPPLWMLKYLPNMLACHVTIIHGAEGPSNTITCAEASGLLSIGESMRIIERGDADLCFSGGAEAPVNLMRHLRMDLAGRLAETGDQTDGASIVRPYDPDATGGLSGEGGGLLILEEHAAATARRAPIHAEIVGYGAAHSSPLASHLPHLVAEGQRPADVDDGLQFAMENALEDAGLTAADIDAIVPHASGIPEMDAAEAGALRAVFGQRLGSIPLVTLTPAIGDTLASGGGLALAVAAKCLREQMLPARLHAGSPAPGLDAGPIPARKATLRHILVATGSLGGQNAAVILRAPRP